jgi:hypothetical protein
METPTFVLLNQTSESVFRVSLDLTTKYKLSLPGSPTKITMPKKKNEPSFPSNLNETFEVQLKPYEIYSTDPWPVGFKNEEWTNIWNGSVVKIDQLLYHFIYSQPLKQFAVPELHFKGAPW